MRFESRSRALATSALAASLGLAGLALTAPPAGAAPAETDRVAGADRYETASDIATRSYPDADTVVLTTGEKLPDALSANPIAGSGDAPILLTLTDSIPESTQAALDGIAPSNVIIVGGTTAVSDAVQQALEEDGYSVTRQAGDDRFGTAADVAGAVGTAPDIDADGEGSSAAAPTVALANGLTGLPDAVAASPMLHRMSVPLLLTGPDPLNEDAAAAISDLGAEQVLLLGGTSAISGDVERQLQDDGVAVERIAGTDRWGTAGAIADLEVDALGFEPASTYLASGLSVADALAGGPLASSSNAPIVLASASSVPGPTADWLEGRAAGIDEVTALGGTAVIGDDVLEEAATLADGSGDAGTVTVTPTDGDTSVGAGGAFTGVLTAEGHEITGVAVSGPCVTADDDLDETDAPGGEEFGFSVPTDADAEAGSCTLTFSVTLAGQDDPVVVTQTITVEPAGGGGGGGTPPAEEPARVESVDTGEEFETLQSAIDAEAIGDGVDTVRAYSADGEPFDELVTITKSGLTLEGSGASGDAELQGSFVIDGADDVTIEGFAVSMFDEYQNASAAFYLDDVAALTLRDNVVTGVGPTTDAKGVLNVTGGETEQAAITANTFTGLMQGVFANPSADFTIDANTFEGNAVGSANDAASDITANTFVGSTIEAVGLGTAGSNVAGNTFDAGEADGEYVCDWTPNSYDLESLAEGNELPDGYAIEDDGTAPDCITQAPGADETRVVSDDTGRAFATIQEAIDAEDTSDEGGSDRLEAYSPAEPFSGPVTVDKSGLTIDGSGDPDGHADLLGTFVVDGADGVTITGFDVSEFDTYQAAAAAFYLDDVEGLVVSDNLVTGSGPEGADKGVLNATGVDAETATITGNEFTGLQQGVFANPSATFTIDRNAFTGNAVGSANDAPSTITANTFSGNTAEAVGLGVSGSTITGNTFEVVPAGVDHLCDYTADGSYDLPELKSTNDFPESSVIDEAGTPDCITEPTPPV